MYSPMHGIHHRVLLQNQSTLSSITRKRKQIEKRERRIPESQQASHTQAPVAVLQIAYGPAQIFMGMDSVVINSNRLGQLMSVSDTLMNIGSGVLSAHLIVLTRGQALSHFFLTRAESTRYQGTLSSFTERI
jgi:hypothetical protein